MTAKKSPEHAGVVQQFCIFVIYWLEHEHGGTDLDLQRIISELERERDRLTQAIDLLKGNNSASVGRQTTVNRHDGTSVKASRLGLTPAGRKRLSEAMKKRWAERRKKAKSPS